MLFIVPVLPQFAMQVEIHFVKRTNQWCRQEGASEGGTGSKMA